MRKVSAEAGEEMIDVIIPTRNAPEILSLCFAYYWLNGHDDRLISSVSIFDNCSTASGMSDVLAGAGSGKFSNLVVFRNEKNVGVWTSVNRGLTLSRSEFILVLTSDVLLGPKATWTMVEILKGNPELHLIGPTVKNGLENLPWLSDISKMSAEINNTTYNGACWMMRRSLLDRVGYFDPQFYVCYGDTDYVQRAQDIGVQYGVSNQARCIHLDKQSRQADHTIDQDNEVEIRDAGRFHQKWEHRPDVLARHPVPNRLLYAIQKERYWKHELVGV